LPLCQFIVEIQEVLEYERSSYLGKTNLTLEEAAAYSGIGINKLREITNNDRCDFVLWVGTKRLIKRKQLDKFTEQCYSL